MAGLIICILINISKKREIDTLTLLIRTNCFTEYIYLYIHIITGNRRFPVKGGGVRGSDARLQLRTSKGRSNYATVGCIRAF